MAVEVDITYEGWLQRTASHGPSGNTITTDAPVDNGGRGEAFSPTDLVAAALGTCIITVMALVAQRSGSDLKGTHIHVIKEMTFGPGPAHQDARRDHHPAKRGGDFRCRPQEARKHGPCLPGQTEPPSGCRDHHRYCVSLIG
jgi:hypothetical protein